LHQAAAVARLFGLDPVAVLTDPDTAHLAVRVAAAQYVVEQENRRQG
jgi:hypothetical protein